MPPLVALTVRHCQVPNLHPDYEDKLQLTLVLSLRISVDKMYLFIFVTLDTVSLSLDSILSLVRNASKVDI